MPTPFNPDGYADLREYVVSEDGWRYLAVINQNDEIATRVDIVGDSRGEWGDPANNPITATVKLGGGNSDVDPPLEVAGAALLANEQDTLGESIHDARYVSTLLLEAGGEIVLKHTVELPEEG